MTDAESLARSQIVLRLEQGGRKNVDPNSDEVTQIYKKQQGQVSPNASPSPSQRPAAPLKNNKAANPPNAAGNNLTENDPDYNTSFKIPKMRSGFSADEIKTFDQNYANDQRRFHYLDGNGNPSNVPVQIGMFGGKKLYRLEFGGNQYYARSIPNNRFVLDLRDANSPVDESGWSSEHGGTEVSPGSKDYQARENAIKTAIDPVTRGAVAYDSKSPGSINSVYGGLDQMQKSTEHQNEALQVERNWQDAQKRNGLYEDSKKILKDLGPVKLKTLIDHAAQTDYAMAKSPDADTQKFYRFLNDQFQINVLGGYTGSGVKGTSGLDFLGKAVPSGYVGAGGAGFNVGVQNVLDAAKSGQINIYDTATNINTNRLLDRKTSINDVSNAVNLPGGNIPVSDALRAEVRKAGKEDIEAGGHKLSDDPLTYGKSYWDEIGADQGDQGGQASQAGQDGKKPKVAGEPTEEEKRLANPLYTPPADGAKATTDDTKAAKEPQKGEEPTPKPTPERTPAGPVIKEAPLRLVSTTGEPTSSGEEFGGQKTATSAASAAGASTLPPFPSGTPPPVAPPEPSSTEEEFAGQPGAYYAPPYPESTSPGGSLTRQQSSGEWPIITLGKQFGQWLQTPSNVRTPLAPPLTPKEKEEEKRTLPQDAESGAPLGAPNDAPGVMRLHQQEHVDALQPGTPFYWRDHPDAYVRV